MELSEIAIQKLLQLFPELSACIVSFRDITDEAGREDTGLRIGLFIVQFGMETYYIPVIAKNEVVLPIDSLFSATEGTFYPLTKSFVDKAISSSQVYLGKATKVPKTVTKNPSVYDLVTPPRTGKFVYASSSRLVEFLGVMPNHVKQAMAEKFAADKETYQTLHKLFGLENIMAALKPTSPVKVVRKPAMEVLTGGSDLSEAEIKSILEKGYALRGENTLQRIAVLANDASQLGPLHTIGGSDENGDYEVILASGELRNCYIPKRTQAAPNMAALLRPYHTDNYGQQPMFALFADGNYAVSSQIVARGSVTKDHKVMQDLFSFVTPVTPRAVSHGDRIAIFSPELQLVGAYSIHHTYEDSSGVTMQGSSLIPGDYRYTGDITINAYRNCKNIDGSNPRNLFIPINSLVVILQDNISSKLEVNVNAALARLELSTLTTLGSAMDMGYDGIEFSVNGRPVGGEVKMAEYLVIGEGIAPEKAEHFIKEAKERRQLKIYMSKKADFEPGEIPQYGDQPAEQKDNFGAGRDGGKMDANLKDAIATQDPQVIESMVISELLQATDMNPLVKEYLPEINAAIDKLGRTLFLARLNMDKLSNSQNSNEVMSFIANLRNVYRLLGDNVTKLERMVSGPEQAQEEAGEAE